MQQAFTPSNARQNFFAILRDTATEHRPIIIQQKDENLDAVIINRKDYEAMEETMALMMNGQLQDALEREKNSVGVTNIDDIDWDNL
ncbi:prevent-host-death protein [Weissella oryzae SG25]|uniref:Antitoxin n=1 Tax=Weissella oryzae (strain DSM 25784 / JCM 18191 / LMG 30913 / SG25) TaxID=1329250 RepID=A0A069CZQ0_WEIOS|nr:type II toxin-antitoxin system Phd/YefM family antitoxin [Weissella oryzae]GAK30581.1 prevent-host-death protein [Weissella oryzae SG25]